MLKKRKKGPVRPTRPIHLGLTGSLASGKTTALQIFRDLGWKTASADQMVSAIYRTRKLSKTKLRNALSGSKRMVRQLEKWVHPLVIKEMKKLFKTVKKPLVIEVPLLFEKGLEEYFDETLYILTPFKERKKRATKRGMKLETFRFLESLQLKSKRKAELADYRIRNSKRRKLKAQIRKLSARLKEKREKL